MSGRAQQAARAAALALGLAVAGAAGAEAAPIVTMPNVALSATPFAVSFGNGANYAFTSVSAAITGNGPGAAVATSGNALVSSFFGGIADFSEGATIDQTGQLYGFSAFPTATLIPNSPAVDFIGLAFTLSDGLHYGYAQVAGPQLVSYGFESIPGASILTGAVAAVPEPASMALLLVGMVGVAATRRRARN